MIDHLARPGPLYWDYRCRRCGEDTDVHPGPIRLLWARLRARIG